MQKHLNTHRFTTLAEYILPGSKSSLLVSLLLLLVGFANQARATGFYKEFIVANGTYYYANSNVGGVQAFQNRDLGSFDRNSGSLQLGGEANTFSDNGDDVQPPQMYYRVYAQGSPGGSFVPLNLSFVRSGDDGKSTNKTWANTSTLPNLLAATSTNGTGNYVIEIYFQGRAVYNNSGGSGSFDFYDNNNGPNYTATFRVTNSIAQWTGTSDNNWFNPSNWSTNQVPGPTTDANIPYNGSGQSSYPTISGGVAQVRTLTLAGNNGAVGARNFLQGGELQIFGNFQDPNGGFGQTGGVFTLAGTTAQTFDGSTFFDFRIQGGGTKTLSNRMDILNSLQFISGQVVTRSDNATTYNIDLGVNAQIIGESESNYVLGILRSRGRIVTQNQPNSFGNIGVELTTMDGSPGTTQVTRITSYTYTGAGTSKSIRRGFIFQPDNPDNLNFSLVFHYLDAELNGIFEGDLRLFRSLSGGIPFQPLGVSSADPSANTLTRNSISGTLAATFTLGDQTNPLPVTLTSFTAVAQGADAMLTWATAQELNSRGFEVQVSGDGTTFRTLGFVASVTPNSSEARTYKYSDTEAGKQGTRYYRLRQLDVDGKESFFGPQAVTFGASVLATSVQGYPNPFGSEINLALQTAAAGPATVSVFDGVGRQVRLVQPTLAAGASSLRLSDLQSLPHGLYVVQVRYSDGQTQRLKVVKE